METKNLNSEIKKLKIEFVEVEKLKPYINNPRKKLNIDKVANSIEEFGFQQPIVIDKDFNIIVGHTRYMASKKLGLTKVPVQIANLTTAQANAYRIADNRLGQDSQWDFDLLNLEIKELEELNFNIDKLGFEVGEIDRILGLGLKNNEKEDFKEISESLKTSHKCPSCGYEFD